MDPVKFHNHLTQSGQVIDIRALPSGPRFSEEIDGAQRETFLKSFPAWVTSPVVSRQGDVFQINFQVDRARGPELLQSLQDTLSQRLGQPVKLLWSLRSRDGEIDRVLRQQLGPQEPYHFVWIPEKNWLKIMLADRDSLSAASVLTIERTLGVECKVVNHHRSLVAPDERGRSLLSEFLPDGFRWQVGRRNGDYVASYQKDPPSTEYLVALRSALARYITKPVIFERRFDAKAFFKEVRGSLPRGTELYKLTLYQTVPGASTAFARLRVDVPAKQRAAFASWAQGIEDHHSIYLDVQYEQAAARVRRQLIPIARRNGGLITRPAQVQALIERFHGEKAPTLPRRSGATMLAVAARQDLTQLPFIAIDPFGTSDPEDMMFAEPMLGGTSIRLIVCFTDASSLVHPGTQHWRYVRKAGYSLYCRFGGETVVVPLLGNQLAFDQFALKQGQKREVWAVEALIDIRPEHRGEIIRSQIFPATAINHHQLSFDHVEKVLQAEPAAYAETIRSLEAATAALRERRFKQSRFPRFFGEYRGEVVVEECMIAANVLTASFAELRKLGFVYRVYQPPDYDRLIEFSQAARKQGLAQINVEDLLDPKRLNALMTALKYLGPPAKPLFLQMLHAFFGQADYDTENRGHKSLGVECYARIKPRCLDGAFNQYALRRHFSHQPLLPEDQAISVANRCRKVQRHKDDNESRLYGLVHAARNAELVGQEFSAEVGRIGVRSLRIFVPGFWKCVMRTKDPARLAGVGQIQVKYLGFAPAAGVHRFSEVDESSPPK